MNRSIINITKNSKLARFVAHSNQIRASNIQTKNKQADSPLINKRLSTRPNRKYGKKMFSTFSNFPIPPEDPNSLLWLAIALGVSYFIVKKL